MLASGGSQRRRRDEWHAEALEALGVPVHPGAVRDHVPRQRWAAVRLGGLTPLDAAMQVAIPEFDGRIIGVPISFKEPLAGRAGSRRCTTRPTSSAAAGWRGSRSATRGCATLAAPSSAIAIVLSSLPDQARADRQRGRARHAGQRDGAAGRAAARPGTDVEHDFADGDELIHALIATGGHDHEFLSDDQLAQATARLPVADYARVVPDAAGRAAEPMRRDLGPAARASATSTATTS